MSSSWRRMALAPCRLLVAAAALIVLARGSAAACVGTDCMIIWSNADGGGALTVEWDFGRKMVRAFLGAPCRLGVCFYSAIDPGFITAGEPHDGFHAIAAGTAISVEIVAIDAGVTLRINDHPLTKAGDSARLGTAPSLHVHPSWLLLLPEGDQADRSIAFKFTTDSSLYEDSQVYTVLLSTAVVSTPTGGATPTPTVGPPECPGDCNADAVVSVDELVRGVRGALGAPFCVAFDLDRDGHVAVNELVAAVAAALAGCPMAPTPTPTPPASFAMIQRTIFSPSCAVATCHDATSHTGNLVLEEDASYEQLVGVAPDIFTARERGLLRVDPGQPDNSLLLLKLAGPSPDLGSRMPLVGGPLAPADIQLVRDWIAQGAPH
jgi:hypothetical protein